MLTSVIASPMVNTAGRSSSGTGGGLVRLHMMQKDMLLALELGRELEVPLPTTAVSNELLTAARGMGIGEHDFAVLFDVLAAMAGVERSVAVMARPSRQRPSAPSLRSGCTGG